ncbi:MAG: hypothetical protein DBX61_11195 [Clostridiales bacterium]|nr:MAG: hypothetical protein DBX61_11195 [Clostridiales bacterium]
MVLLKLCCSLFFGPFTEKFRLAAKTKKVRQFSAQQNPAASQTKATQRYYAVGCENPTASTDLITSLFVRMSTPRTPGTLRKILYSAMRYCIM